MRAAGIPGKRPFSQTIIIKQNRKKDYAGLERHSTIIIKIGNRQNFYFSRTNNNSLDIKPILIFHYE